MADSFGSSLMVRPGDDAPLVEARVTAPDDPGGGGSADRGQMAYAAYQLGFTEADLWGDNSRGNVLAMNYSAVYACVRAIVNSLASVSWHTYLSGPDGRSKLPIEDDVSWMLGLQANPEMGAIDWRQATVKDALLTGNSYSEVERLNNGRPTALWRIEPSRVELIRDDSKSLWYEIDNGIGNKPTYLRPDDVFHLKGLSPDGLVGWSVIDLARRSIELGLAEERFGVDFFSRGPMPGGMVTIPGNMNQQQRNEFRKSFEALYSGARNQHRIVVMSNGITFEPANLPNDSAQFLQSRLFQIGEIARWFGVPPQKLADLQHVNFSIAEEMERAYVTDCILPWACRLESEANLKLYGRTNRGRRFTKLNLDALLRGNSQTQATTIASKVAGGLMTHNEGREYFDLNPVGKEGDVLLVQGAMTPLERVVNPPEPPPPPAPPATPKPAESGNAEPPAKPTDPPTPDAHARRNGKPRNGPARAELVRAFGPLLAEAYGRLYRVDADKAKRAAKQGRLAQHAAEWYAPSAAPRVAVILRPAFDALTAASGRPGWAAAIASEAAARHVERGRAAILTGVSLDDWQALSEAVAATEIRAYDPDQERDADGRFGSGGGDSGSESGKGGGDKEQSKQDDRDQEDADRQDDRDRQDNEREVSRSDEESAVSDQREKEDAEREGQREKEDAAAQAERDSHDAKAEQRDAQREKEDADRADKREAEDKDVEDRHEKGEINDAQREKEHEKNDKAREKEDAVVERTREKEDAEHDKQTERLDKQDEQREKSRDKEDAAVEKDRERQDKELEKRWAKEDKETEQQRKAEDRAVKEKRKAEDTGK